ncbi:MAG: sigma-70 family RNA polymerase sigma factor, partial [Blastocatellia bacterium]|nr:sigma-70 family RNA polymerase sigma factor [Blastocatellia bacterium]
LGEVKEGSQDAVNRLFPLVQNELRRLAERYFDRERPGHTLQPTVLVQDAYLRLVNDSHLSWPSRHHFYSIAARAMRQILVDYARRRKAAKRGGEAVKVSMDQDFVKLDHALAHFSVAKEKEQEEYQKLEEDLIHLDKALSSLAEIDKQKSLIVELRFYAGCSFEEVGKQLGITVDQVRGQWKLARAWLHREIDRKENEA